MKLIFVMFFPLTVFCQDTLTRDMVYDYIISSCIEHPEVVFKQAMKETGHLKCTSCSMDKNNLFGFWNGERYLEFDTWEESIDYYEDWQIRKGYDGKEDYYEFLKRKWGAPHMDRYIRTLKITY